MNIRVQGLTALGAILIILGVIFLLLNLIPGIHLGQSWPLVFVIIAAAFAALPFMWPSARTALAVFLIPGGVLLSLGLIFLYASTTQDWSVWAFAWTLIPAGAGVGLSLAARIGSWGQGAVLAGFWMLIGNLALFIIIGLLVNAPFIRSVAPFLLIALGALILLRSISGPR